MRMRTFPTYSRIFAAIPTLALAGTLFSLTPTAQAALVFNFSDTGSGTTLVTGSGTVNLTGTTAATSPHNRFVGWDNFNPSGTNQSKSLVADSDFFSFNNPAGVGSGFFQYSANLGTTALNVSGVNLSTTTGLWLDGATSLNNHFFVLNFGTALAQTGVVTASGTATLNYAFSNLPYAAGESVDLQGNGNVIFQFGTFSVPEPGSLALLGIGLAGLGFIGRRKA